MAKPDVIVVTGPTASGKSALALALAEARGGTVINADAMQTYDAFPILTAQPSEAERARAPHALYGVLPPSETLSAARWRALADVEIERCVAEGRLPILCGGSGLYLRTLMQGIAAIPDAPAGLALAIHPERIIGHLDYPKPPAFVPIEGHGIEHQRLRRHQLGLEARRHMHLVQ